MPVRHLTRRTPAGMHVLVTGAASGIGRSVAGLLGAGGAVLYLTDLRDAALQQARAELEGSGATVALAHAADLSVHPEVVTLAGVVHAIRPAMDAVLNVAGIAVWGKVEHMSHEQWRSVIDVNLMGPVHVVESFVPPMVAAGKGGHLVNVSSAAGLIGLPWHAAYSASKFGLRGMSEVLRFDLARHRIAVTLVCPGGVDTPLTSTVQVAGVDTADPRFQRMRRRFERRAVSPEHAARQIVAGMLARRYLVYTSRDIQAIHLVQRLFPPGYAMLMDGANRIADRASRTLA